MGFISGAGLYDKGGQDEDKEMDDLSSQIESNTRKVAEQMFPTNYIQFNRLYQHLILTQKLIIYDRIDSNPSEAGEKHHSSFKEFLKSYIDVLPREDLTQLIFWPKHVLTEIDSKLLIQQYKDTSNYYLYLHKLLTTNPDSPYLKNNADLPLDQFLWAFSIVSSR